MEGSDIIEHEAHKIRMSVIERVDGVVDGNCGDQILTHNQERGVSHFGDDLRIGKHAKRRRVNDDIAVLLAQCLQNRPERIGGEGLCLVTSDPFGKKNVETAMLQAHDRVLERLVGKATGHQGTEVLAVGHRMLKYQLLGGLAQIRVQQQYPVVLLGQRQGEIGGNGGFSLIFAATGHKKDLLSLLLMGALQKDPELVDGLRVIKTDGGIGDQQRGLLALPKALEGAVFPLVVDRG